MFVPNCNDCGVVLQIDLKIIVDDSNFLLQRKCNFFFEPISYAVTSKTEEICVVI